MASRVANQEVNRAPRYSPVRGDAFIPADEHLVALVGALPHPAGIVRVIDGTARYVVCNQRYEEFLSERARSFSGTALWTDSYLGDVERVASGRATEHQIDLSYNSALGPKALRGYLSHLPTEPGEPPMALVTVIDHTDHSRIEQVLRRELLTDPLTALPNRAGFLEMVEGGSYEPGSSRAVLMLDLIRFSRINESLGPIAGDEIIITVARRIKAVLRAGDTLARVGGNEFAIFSSAIDDPEVAARVAERARDALASPIRIGSYSINVEAAVGCAVDPIGVVDAEELFRRAQAAVKRAKFSNRFEVHRQNTLVEAQQRFVIESRLRDALDEDALHLQLQPFADLKTGKIVGFEALARWNDSVLGMVSPSEFIPVAEESGLIVHLGRWALTQTARILAEWDERLGTEADVMMNVNLSPVQISRDDVSQAVREALDGAGIDGRRITVEMTESAVVADIKKTRLLLDELKAMQVSIAMDDFGTGFSNLANLQMLPIDVLKIDRSFVTDMVGDGDKTAIVRAILSLARTLGMKTVAEGIETAEAGKALAALGCDRGQGYFYARPMTVDDAFAYWSESRSRDSN